MPPAKSTYAAREPGTSSSRGGREASRLELLLLVRATWRCQLPACEPDSLPSCAPQPVNQGGLTTAFISTSTTAAAIITLATGPGHAPDYASDDSLLIIANPTRMPVKCVTSPHSR